MLNVSIHNPTAIKLTEFMTDGHPNVSMHFSDRDGAEIGVFFDGGKRQCARDMAQVFSLHHDTKIAHRADKMRLLSAALIAVDDPNVETLRALWETAADMAYENCCNECGGYAEELHEDPAGKYVCAPCFERIAAGAAEAKQAGAEDKADADYRQRCLDDRGATA